jgi:hypothetical protein
MSIAGLREGGPPAPGLLPPSVSVYLDCTQPRAA